MFPDIETINHSGLAKNSESEDSEFGAGIDFFLTANYKKLRFLGEYLLAKDEQELERLQFGFSFDESTVWVGRFHNPIGYWNTNFHHGRFLETSASRPAIANFEDDGGILPMHISGLLAEGTYAYGERGLGYSFALGAGPSSTMHGLEPWDAINPSSGKQDISATLNVFIEPMVYAPTKFGFYVNYTDIPTQGITATGIQQISAGLYGNWESFPWRILSSSFYVHTLLSG
ncbi:MAG: hypothetical protein H6936_17445 [Burkholderiales bacterium]|nr:hypothetical protein [Burkholderiales bacterium]